MLKKTITYTDYNGNERTEDFYFNLNKAELVEMELSHNGGLSNIITKITAQQDSAKLIEIFKDLITRSYGEKSLDGRKFIKNKEVLEDFVQTEAYNKLFMELAFDAKAAADFCNGIMPSQE